MNSLRRTIVLNVTLLKSAVSLCCVALTCSTLLIPSCLIAGQGEAEAGRPGSQVACDLPEVLKPIGLIRTDIRPALQNPLTVEEQAELDRCNQSYQSFGVLDYQGAMICHWWDYGSLAPLYPYCYQPLYFEDVNLERCGYSAHCCVQPLISGAHFFGTCGILPFKMIARSPCSCVEPQADCPPCERYSTLDNYFGPFPESRWSWPWSRNSR